ncbi:MAG: 3-dehydroquinate synthase II, partial [Candidatus Hydrothermarchaeales archaeon]
RPLVLILGHRAAGSETLDIKVGTVKTIKPVVMGDRVCIDTASLLSIGEGMLIGSQANGLFLVHSESLESEYVASRPFRVNAGAVHAYVLVPGGKTKYLSDLVAGDEVLAVDSEGRTRTVVVGRVKIEKRPLMLVEVESDGKTFKTLLQNAETINLVEKEGRPISISKLKVGDEILLYTKDVGRHFGMEVEESLIER